jgi:hypothetical protein
MYYPKSQIKTNLYTNGSELVTTTNNQLYQGYYYETSNGQLFTGKNPQDGPNILLSRQNLTTLYDPTNVLDNPDFDNTIYYYNITDINYNDATNTDTNQVRIIPSFNPTLPTDQDKINGQFNRYFCKKNNELKYLEINQDTYQKLQNKDPKIAWDLYTPAIVLWIIQGNQNQVFLSNKATVQALEQNIPWYGFTQYFQDKFLKYYLES